MLRSSLDHCSGRASARSMRASIVAAAACAAILSATGVAAADDELIWDTTPGQFNSSTSLGSLNEFGADNQVADDFNLVAQVRRIVAHGAGCSACGPPTIAGVRVRFFEWTPDGPGAIQQETFVPAGDPGLVFDLPLASQFDVTLPEPFTASGWHFVSVQPAYDVGGEWRMRRSNLGVPVGAVVQYRAAHLGQPWHDDPNAANSDFSIELWGELQAAPTLEPLVAPATPSQRLVVRGSNFGAEQGESTLLVEGAAALVTTWTADTIIGYVPEATPAGTAEVRVVTSGGTSDAAPLVIVPRQRDGRVRWRFAVDGPYMLHRPGIGPDGTVYINDLKGRLYAVSSNGGLEWIADALRDQPGLGTVGPVAVGADGRIYVGVQPLGPTDDLVAFNPDGTVAWVYTDPDALGIAAGPAVGPDGNVYVAFHDSDMLSSGCTSLTPEGVLRWSNNGDPPLYEHGGTGSELVFGASVPGGPIDQVILTVDRNLAGGQLYGFDMETGAQNFSTEVSGLTNGFETQHQPATHPASGAIYLAQFTGPGGVGWNLHAFDASGAFEWLYDPGISAGLAAPDVGSDGVVYIAWDGRHLGAVDPDGTPRWEIDDAEAFDDGPVVAPTNDVVAVNGGTAQQTWWTRGFDPADGAELWRVEYPQENGDDIVTFARPKFTPDGATAYIPTSNGGYVEHDYGYLYAIDATVGAPADLDGDGVVGIGDLIILLVAWGPCADCGACPADLDGSCDVGILDLLVLLSSWG